MSLHPTATVTGVHGIVASREAVGSIRPRARSNHDRFPAWYEFDRASDPSRREIIPFLVGSSETEFKLAARSAVSEAFTPSLRSVSIFVHALSVEA